ncbi:MAG: hypothetical protein K8R60_10415 [Burkholderiales bacterium]|nr:hypothetical protein [Burkholderiales bacterium]
MEPGRILQAQLEVLRLDLVRSRKAAEAAEVEPELRNRVAARFDVELTRVLGRVDALKAAIDKAERSPESAWRELRELQAEAGRVLDECLAFVQGALARKAGMDEGICALTDLLLADLATAADVAWGRFTLLATSEFYRDMAEVIRIRYPEVSLWSMPFAAHEFGHFIGPALSARRDGAFAYPFQELLKTADEKAKGEGQAHSREWHHLQESFADVFATCTLGPAYAAAFILLRMNPTDANASAYTHPSAAARVHAILWTLDKLDATHVAGRLRDVTAMLRELWAASLRLAGQADKLADAAASFATENASRLFDLLVGATPPGLMFDAPAWNRSQALALVPPPAVLVPATTRCDVLNAAWLARLGIASQNRYELNDLEHSALAAFRRIA